MTNQPNPRGIGTTTRKPPKRTEAELNSWIADAYEETEETNKQEFLEALKAFRNGEIDYWKLMDAWREI